MRASPKALVVAVLLTGCSSSATRDNSNTGGAGGVSSTSGGSAAQCDAGPGYATAVTAQSVSQVSAILVDTDDQPVANEVFEVCGTDICSPPATSGSDGHVAVASSTPLVEKKPAAKFGEGKITPRFAWLLPNQAVIDLGTLRTIRLPDLSTSVPLVAGSEASSGGLTLVPPAGSNVAFDLLTFDSNELGLRAVQIPLDRAPAVVDPSLGLELVYAATPTDTRFCPPALLRVDNSLGWAAGTDVEVLLHGVDIEEEWAPYGGWAKVSDARVTSDGSQIETTSPGLPLLGVLGFRRK